MHPEEAAHPFAGDPVFDLHVGGKMETRSTVALTGRDPLGVTSIQPTDDGWRIGVEVVEDHRIPASTDLLGLYEVELDMTGSLLGYRRTRRYQRGKGD